MSWTYVAGTSNRASSYVTYIDMPDVLNVAAGDVLIGVVGWYADTDTVISIAATTGNANAMTLNGRTTGGTEDGVFGYKINADANSTATFRFSSSNALGRICACLMQWRPSSAADVSLVAGGAEATGGDTNPTSGAISPTGSDLLLIGGGISYYGVPSNGVIAGSAADQTVATVQASLRSTGYLMGRAVGSNQTGVIAEWDIDSARRWYANFVAFNIASSESTGNPMLMMDHFNGGVAL